MKILFAVVLALCAVVFGDVNNLENELVADNIQEVHKQLEDVSVNMVFRDQSDDIVTPDGEGLLLEHLGSRNFIAQIIQDTLESFRDVVINGNENLPPLDPLVIDHAGPLEYSDTGIRVVGNIRDLRAEGLRWYVVNDVSFNVLRLNLNAHVILPWLSVRSSYDMEARLAIIISHRAGGNVEVFINNLNCEVDVRLGTNILSGRLVLRELAIKLGVNDVAIRIDGMTGSSIINSVISNFIQNLTQDIVQNNMDELGQIISEALFDPINDILKDFTLADILG